MPHIIYRGDKLSILELGITQVTAITIICYLAGIALKAFGKAEKYVPAIIGALGGVLGIVAMYVIPDFMGRDILNSAAIGIVSGLAGVGLEMIVKDIKK